MQRSPRGVVRFEAAPAVARRTEHARGVTASYSDYRGQQHCRRCDLGYPAQLLSDCLGVGRILQAEDIYPVFRELFRKQHA